jgi:predicted HD superfamily hydrolase involved in NAD metabolism
LTFTELARRVRSQIGQAHRYAHSVRVARCADVLAQRHGADPSKARTAGMLHDLARLYEPQRLLDECEMRGMPIGAFERAHPMLLHARLGAVLARELFGVRDGDVLSAIEKHTTAAGEMSPLDCVVYLADSLEPNRSFAERGELWESALHDLYAATRDVLRLSIRHYAAKGKPLAPPTAAAARTFGIEPSLLEEVSVSAI